MNDLLSRKHFSPSQTLEGLFELTQRPSSVLDSPRALLPQLQRKKNIVMCALLGGAEVQGLCQKQLTQTLIVHFFRARFFY